MSKEKRRCEICGAFLSRYNPNKVCFHHPEHPNYKQTGRPLINRDSFKFTSGPVGNDFTRTLIEYEGAGGRINY